MTSLFEEYWHDEHHPLGAHLGLMVTYNVGLGTVAMVAEHRGLLRDVPRLADVVLVGVATFKLSRIIATERVTTSIRAPFLEREGERPTPAGKGLRRALGELMTCPYCLAPWCALGVGTALIFAPRPTRFISGLLASMAVADALQRIYARLENRRPSTPGPGRQPSHST